MTKWQGAQGVVGTILEIPRREQPQSSICPHVRHSEILPGRKAAVPSLWGLWP